MNILNSIIIAIAIGALGALIYTAIIFSEDDKLRGGMVVVSVEKSKYYKGCKFRAKLNRSDTYFIDSCGKFQVGDTIKIVKK